MKIKVHSSSQNRYSINSVNTLRLRKLALAIALTLSVSAPSLAQAATYTVTNTNDDALAGSLRKAVDDANNNLGADTIEFNIPPNLGNTINLGSELVITDSVTIKGPIEGEPNSIILDGGGTPYGNRHINAGGFPVNSGQTITLENITLQNGYYAGTISDGGGAVFVKNADLFLKHTLILDNSSTGNSTKGGGLYVRSGNATLIQSTVSGNSASGNDASGGGLSVWFGDAILTQSTVSGNSITNLITKGGGGISVRNGNATLMQSTVSGNLTTGITGIGGGLYVRLGDALLTQSTVSGNSTTGVAGKGGGICVWFGDAILTQSTVSGNSTTGSSAEGGALYINSGKTTITQSTIVNNSVIVGAGGISADMNGSIHNVTLINSILSANTGPEDNFEDRATTPVGLLKATNSLFGDENTEITDPASIDNKFSNTPDLGPLQHNGGLTQTHKPNESSVAFNSGNNALIPVNTNTDQRGAGFSRIHNVTVDIGAVELQNNTAVGDPPLSIGEVITRRDLARELLKGVEGDVNYIPLDPNNNNEPYQVTGIFDDVGVGDINAVFIEEFQRRGFTDGCAPKKFCPNAIVTRAEMAKIFLKAYHNNGNYTPPTAQGVIFSDVALPTSFNIDSINDLESQEFTVGCGLHPTTGNLLFCPQSPVTREWFDALLNKL